MDIIDFCTVHFNLNLQLQLSDKTVNTVSNKHKVEILM